MTDTPPPPPLSEHSLNWVAGLAVSLLLYKCGTMQWVKINENILAGTKSINKEGSCLSNCVKMTVNSLAGLALATFINAIGRLTPSFYISNCSYSVYPILKVFHTIYHLW